MSGVGCQGRRIIGDWPEESRRYAKRVLAMLSRGLRLLRGEFREYFAQSVRNGLAGNGPHHLDSIHVQRKSTNDATFVRDTDVHKRTRLRVTKCQHPF